LVATVVAAADPLGGAALDIDHGGVALAPKRRVSQIFLNSLRAQPHEQSASTRQEKRRCGNIAC